MELSLQRTILNNDCTIGELCLEDAFYCYTLEDRVREIEAHPVKEWKIPGKTAIPSGRYEIRMGWSNHFQRMMPFLIEVEGYTGVMIHPGTTAEDTRGCILVGAEHGETDLRKSRVTSDALNAKLQALQDAGKRIYITIHNPSNPN